MSRSRIPRRMFLRAAGATAVVGLPLLESLGTGQLPWLEEVLGPSRAKAQAAGSKFVVFMRQANGRRPRALRREAEPRAGAQV